MRKRKEFPTFNDVEITDIAVKGRGFGKVNELAVFVKDAIPGDIINIKLTKKKSNYAEADILEITTPSPDRISPFCSHFYTCGGCKLQHLSYSKQLQFKHKQVIDNLSRIGKSAVTEISEIKASEKTQYYRNKLEYTFSNKRWLTNEEIGSTENFTDMEALGFHIPGKFDKVLDIKHCYLQEEPSNSIRNKVKEYAIKNNIAFFDIRSKEGSLRNLIIRTSSTGEIMVILVIKQYSTEISQLLSFIQNEFPQITALYYVENAKVNDTIHDLEVCLYSGKDFILEQMEDLKFQIGPKSFYQTNSQQAYLLYQITREFAQINNNDLVYDLYTGTGTIANFIARKAKKVVGIEYVPEAIEDAKINSAINNIDNTVFFAGDMAKVLTPEFCNEQGYPDIIITDPPRAGMHEDVIKQLLSLEAKRIVYVSCNPATQARDIALMSDKYKLTKVQPVDMFPHTEHVENIVLLELIQS